MNRGRRKLLIGLGAAALGGATLGAVVARGLNYVQGPPTSELVVRPGAQRIQRAQLVTRIEGAVTTPRWSPAGDAIAVEHLRAGARVATVYEVPGWTVRFTVDGSLPAWSPGSDRLAVISPFPQTTPPAGPLSVRTLNARDGREIRRMSAATATLAWGAGGLRGVVEGEIVSLDEQAARKLSGCDGACGVVLWSADTGYVASVDLREAKSEYQVRSAATGAKIASLGEAKGLVSWSATGAALIGTFDRGPLVWQPNGIQSIAFPSGHLPVAAGPEGEIVLGATSGAVPLQWSQWSAGSPLAELVGLPLQSTRGISWDPRGRYMTSLNIGFGATGSLEIFALEFGPR